MLVPLVPRRHHISHECHSLELMLMKLWSTVQDWWLLGQLGVTYTKLFFLSLFDTGQAGFQLVAL